MAAAISSESREDKENSIVWFPIDGEKVFIPSKGEIYIPFSVTNKRWNRQRQHSVSELEEAPPYFPYKDEFDNENVKYQIQSTNSPYVLYNDFQNNKNQFPLRSQSFNEILKKNQRDVQFLNQKKVHSASQKNYDVKKYITSHYKLYEGLEPYYDMEYQKEENYNWPEQYHDLKLRNDRNFESEKPEIKFVKDLFFPNIYISSFERPRRKQRSHEFIKLERPINGPHTSNYFKTPNRPGVFIFPDSFELNGFNTPSEIQHQNHFNSFYNQNINNPSADLILSSSTTDFITHQSNSAQPNWPTTPLGSDNFVFPGETNKGTKTPFPTFTTNNSKLSTASIDCERMCQVTPEFNPVCGTDYKTYSNIGKLKCAKKCGKDVNFYHYGSCGKSIFVTPLH